MENEKLKFLECLHLFVKTVRPSLSVRPFVHLLHLFYILKQFYRLFCCLDKLKFVHETNLLFD